MTILGILFLSKKQHGSNDDHKLAETVHFKLNLCLRSINLHRPITAELVACSTGGEMTFFAVADVGLYFDLPLALIIHTQKVNFLRLIDQQSLLRAKL